MYIADFEIVWYDIIYLKYRFRYDNPLIWSTFTANFQYNTCIYTLIELKFSLSPNPPATSTNPHLFILFIPIFSYFIYDSSK